MVRWKIALIISNRFVTMLSDMKFDRKIIFNGDLNNNKNERKKE